MTLSDGLVGLTLVLLLLCVVFWPTQLISDHHYRWLRIAAVSMALLHLIVGGRHVPLIPAYLVAALFAILLVVGPGTDGEPSEIRESKEGIKKKLVRWVLVGGSGSAVLVSMLWYFALSRWM